MEELLSTFLLAIYNQATRDLLLKIAGDGCFAINGQITCIDQNNVPNYPAYHLNKTFSIWLEKEVSTVHESNVQDFSIATDGVESFVQDGDFLKQLGEKPIPFFLTQKDFLNREMPLLWRLRQLQKEKIRPLDDVAIIRVINPL